MLGQCICVCVVVVEVLQLFSWFVVVQVVELYLEGFQCILFVVLVGQWDIVDVEGVVGVVVYGIEVVIGLVGDGKGIEGG